MSLRTGSSATRAQDVRSQHNYVWTTDKTRILALQAGGQLYNAKDLRGVEPKDIGRYAQLVALVKFANGKELEYSWQGLSWRICDSAKVCSGLDQDDDGVVHAMPLEVLENSTRRVNIHQIPLDPRNAVSKGQSALPLLAPYKHTVVISSPEQAARDSKQLTAILANYDKNGPAREAAKQRSEDAMKAQARLHQQAKEARTAPIRNEKVGVQTMCESGAVSGADSSRDRSVKCSRYGETSVAEMVELGWNIVGASTQQVVGDLGRPLFVHRLTMQKVK